MQVDYMTEAAYDSWRMLKPTETQMLLFTMYAESDATPLPTTINRIIERHYHVDWLKKMDECKKYYDDYVHHTSFVITHAAVLLGKLYIPVLSFDHCHKHFCICSFDSEVHPLIKRLPIWEKGKVWELRKNQHSVLLTN